VPKDQVFISYSHRDNKSLAELETHLKPYLRKGNFSCWSDQQIKPGSIWFEQIQSTLANSKIAVLLVSPDFFSSDFIHEQELGPLLKKAEQGAVKILWIPVRASSYDQTALERYQALHDPNKPLSDMSKAKRDTAWVRICKRIKEEAGQTDESWQPPNLEQSNPTAQQPAPAAARQVLSQSGRIPSSSSSQPALEWRDSLVHIYYGTAPAIYTQAIEYSAKNVSNRPVQLEQAHFTSAITNDTIEAKVVTTVGLLNPSETTPIFPSGSVTLRAEFNSLNRPLHYSPGGLPAQEFMKVWGKMVLHVKYDGIIHQVPIGKHMTRNLFTGFQPNPLEPTVNQAITTQTTGSQAPFSSGQKFLAGVAAQVNAEQQRFKADVERMQQQRIFRAEITKKSLVIIRESLERLWAKIRAVATDVESVEKEAVPSLHLRWGLANMEFEPMNVIPNAFKESNWEVMEGFYIRLSQAEPQYTWSGNLWLLRLPDTEDFRWFEVSYFEPLTSRPRMAPFGVLVFS